MTSGGHDEPRATAARSAITKELRRRFRLGEVVVGQLLEVDGERFRIEGFDPVGIDARHVYVRSEHGEHLTLQIENG